MSSRFHRHEFDFLPELAFRPRGGRGGPMTLEGESGGSTPPPDPRLVEAQVKSMATQDAAIQKIIQQSEEMMPLQREQMQFGLDTSRTSFNQAQEDRTWALGRRGELVAAQQPLIDEANNFNEGTRRQQMMAQSDADVSSAFNVTRGQGSRALQRVGATPQGGRFQSFNSQANIGEAIARASAGRKVSEAAKAEGLNLRTNAANMLSGYPALASSLSGTGFGYGTSGLGIANQGVAGMASGYTTAAGIAGNQSQTAAGAYNGQLSAYGASQTAAANNQSATIGAGVGAVATIAAAFI